MRDLGSAAPAHDAPLEPNFERLAAERRKAAPAPAPQPERLPAKVYGVMALTTALTFATLNIGYELFFSYQPFA